MRAHEPAQLFPNTGVLNLVFIYRRRIRLKKRVTTRSEPRAPKFKLKH